MKAAVSSHSLAACLSRIKARDGFENGTVMLSYRTINSLLLGDVELCYISNNKEWHNSMLTMWLAVSDSSTMDQLV